MPLALARCATIVGVSGHVVEVEAHLGGLPGFSLVGSADSSVHESRERVRPALLSSGEPWPTQRLTVNLSPAALPKRGTQFDLALAAVVVGADGRLPLDALEGVVLLGELGLDGRLRATRGILPAVMAVARRGWWRVVVPRPNEAEARLVPGVDVFAAATLRQVLAYVRGEAVPDDEDGDGADRPGREGAASPHGVDGRYGASTMASNGVGAADLADVLGQAVPRRAVEIAAAGRHHVLLHGPPGTGKTMLARRLPGVLPDLDDMSALEVTAVHSLAGLLPTREPLVRRPPVADPHHSASLPAVVGGGGRQLRPGAASLAHRGVLLLDEVPEFQGRVLDSLRQPLEQGEVVVARVDGHVRFPARFQLVLTANPCPCGYHGSTSRECLCTPDQVRRYALRMSGPIRDRLDLVVPVGPIPTRDAVFDDGSRAAGEASAVVRDRVAAARERARSRLVGTGWSTNGEVPGDQWRLRWPLPAGAHAAVDGARAGGLLTERGAAATVRLAWTIADLAGRDAPVAADVHEALALRTGVAA